MNDSEYNLIFDVIEQLRSVGLNNMAQDVYNASVNVDSVHKFANSISQTDLDSAISNLQETYLRAIRELTEHYNIISNSKREADINEVQHKFNFLKPENREVRLDAYLYNRMNDFWGKIQVVYNRTLDNFKQSTSDFKRAAFDSWNKFVGVMNKAKKSFSLGKDFFVSKWKREYYGVCMKIHAHAMTNCQKWINHFEAAEKIVNRVECKLNDMFYKMANSQVNIRSNNVVNAVRGKEFISNLEVKPKHFKLADLFRKGFNKGIIHFKNKFKANYDVMQDYLNKIATIPNTVYSISLKDMRGGEIYGIYNKLDENNIDFDVKEKDDIGYIIFKSKEDFIRAFDVVNDVRSAVNGINVETEVNTFDDIYESVEPDKTEVADVVQDVVEDIGKPVIEEIVPAEYISIDTSKKENTVNIDDKDVGKETNKDIDMSTSNYIHLDLSDNDFANAVCEIADKYEIDYSKEGTSLYLNETEENSRNFNMVCEEAQAYVSDKKLNHYRNNLPGIKIHSSAEESIRENYSRLMDVAGNNGKIVATTLIFSFSTLFCSFPPFCSVCCPDIPHPVSIIPRIRLPASRKSLTLLFFIFKFIFSLLRFYTFTASVLAALIFCKSKFQIKTSLFFSFFRHLPIFHLIQIREISVRLEFTIYLCYIYSITIWKHHLVNALATEHINLLTRILLQFL